MEISAQKSIANFFKYMGTGFVILCLKSLVIQELSYKVVQTLFFTFMYCFTISIWIGLAGMFSIDFYQYLKKNLNINLICG